MSFDSNLTELNAYHRTIKDFTENDLVVERKHHIKAALGSVVLTAVGLFVGKKFGEANPYTFSDYVGGWTAVLLSTGAIANTLAHTIQTATASLEFKSRTAPEPPKAT